MNDLQDAVTLARDADEALENEISAACARLSMATTQHELYENFEQLRRLVAQRSPDQIARMERQRGLRK